MPEEKTAPRHRGTYAKGIARRQEILDRAIEVFAERSADRTSLRAIARKVSVTHAALKYYFGSLEELLVSVYRESAESAKQSIPADRTPVEMMIESARANREVPELVQQYSSLIAAALEEDHPPARDFATTRFARLREELTERIEQRQTSGRMRPDVEPLAVAALVIAASDGLQTHVDARRSPPPPRRKRWSSWNGCSGCPTGAEPRHAQRRGQRARRRQRPRMTADFP